MTKEKSSNPLIRQQQQFNRSFDRMETFLRFWMLLVAILCVGYMIGVLTGMIDSYTFRVQVEHVEP